MGSFQEGVFRSALHEHRAGNLERAEALYWKCLENQRAGGVAANLGALYRNKGNLNKALKFYTWALHNCNPHPNLYINAANLNEEAKNINEAIRILHEGNNTFPHNEHLIKTYALLLIKTKRYITAIEAILNRIEASESKQELRGLIDAACIKLYETDRQKVLELIINRDRKNSVAIFRLAICLKDIGDNGKAYKLIRKVEEAQYLAADDVFLLKAKAALLKSSGNAEEAEKIYTLLCSNDTKDPSNFINLAATQRDLKKICAPKAVVVKGLKLFPNNKQLRMSLMQIVADEGDEVKVFGATIF